MQTTTAIRTDRTLRNGPTGRITVEDTAAKITLVVSDPGLRNVRDLISPSRDPTAANRISAASQRSVVTDDGLVER